jgi:UDP-N-acetylmuramoyl-tripeptide--D-alanyl-D-alanine ligase
LSADPFVTIKAENGDQVLTKLIGAYNFENVMAALCIGKYFKVDPTQANDAIQEYNPGNMRSQMVKKGSNTIILDAYNANPTSMQAAIENLAAMNADRKALILGDMFELGEDAEKEHRELGKLISEKKFDNVYLCGQLFKAALQEIPSAQHFENKADLVAALQGNPLTDAVILVKASRGIGLETILEHL